WASRPSAPRSRVVGPLLELAGVWLVGAGRLVAAVARARVVRIDLESLLEAGRRVRLLPGGQVGLAEQGVGARVRRLELGRLLEVGDGGRGRALAERDLAEPDDRRQIVGVELARLVEVGGGAEKVAVGEVAVAELGVEVSLAGVGRP